MAEGSAAAAGVRERLTEAMGLRAELEPLRIGVVTWLPESSAVVRIADAAGGSIRMVKKLRKNACDCRTMKSMEILRLGAGGGGEALVPLLFAPLVVPPAA